MEITFGITYLLLSFPLGLKVLLSLRNIFKATDPKSRKGHANPTSETGLPATPWNSPGQNCGEPQIFSSPFLSRASS